MNAEPATELVLVGRPLDGRLKVRGQPVSRIVIKPREYTGWFKVRRAGGPEGVVLEIRIPGYLDEDREFADLGDARVAADQIYAEYRQAIEGLAS